MDEITESELLDVIRENPMICTRAIVKNLRPEDFRDPELYKAHLDSLKPLLNRLWTEGTIVSSKVQCCTFNLKQWQIA
jgi:hypothetical protein